MRYRILFSLLLVGSAASPLAAQDDRAAFAGTHWGETRAAVAGKLEAAGFTAIAGSDEDVRLYQGSILGDTTMVFATFDTTARLRQIVTLMKPGALNSLERYRTLVDLLSKKYGHASVVAEHYAAPYKQGDPGAVAGIRTGAVRLATTWKLDTELITLTIGRTYDVVVSYEPATPPERAERLF